MKQRELHYSETQMAKPIYSGNESRANILNQKFSSVFKINSDEDVGTIPDKGPISHSAKDYSDRKRSM